MSYVFDTKEFLFLGGSNERGCLAAFPSAKRKIQKIVFGNKSGLVQFITLKSGTPKILSKTQERKGVTALSLGGPPGSKDKLFVAHGNKIKAMTKKGKTFFAFEAPITDDIKALFVENPSIYTCCEFNINHFEAEGSKVTEKGFFNSQDVIHAMCPMPHLSENGAMGAIVVALGCEDRYIRIVDGTKMIAHPKIPGSVTALTLEAEINRDAETPVGGLVYGTDNGKVGQINVRKGGGIRPGWMYKGDGKKAAITALDAVDVLQDGVPDVVVAREDGSIEVLNITADGPSLKYSEQISSETITSVIHGNIVSMNTDLLASTYSGRLVSLTFKEEDKMASAGLNNDGDAAAGKEKRRTKNNQKGGDAKSSSSAASSAEALKLEADIQALQQEIKDMKTKFSSASSQTIAAQKQFNMNYSMKLDEENACYTLAIEIELPIEMVVLHSDVPLLLMETDTNQALLSQTEADRKEKSAVLATYTCVTRTTKLRIRLRTVEGQFGTISAYVIPKTSPKTSQRLQVPVKPLSLHAKVDYAEAKKLQEGAPVNTLDITGDFSLAQVHAWISIVLPGIPARLSSDRAELGYRSCFIDSTLTCLYCKGKASFVSESVTVITIIKEVISREATKRQVRIEIQLDAKKESIFHMLKMLRPRLDHHFSLNREHRLLGALKEIQSHEDELSFLSQEYQSILTNEEKIREEMKSAPKHLAFLKGIVMDLYVDKYKLLTGVEPKNSEACAKALDAYNFDSLLMAFK
mmetsp:Transcript_12169/g.16817  ORF Transcript_12169/g.16817 Transcript_12169/m.16817 type:complete len:749 (+) Transcript_12169:68-2314(+)